MEGIEVKEWFIFAYSLRAGKDIGQVLSADRKLERASSCPGKRGTS